MTAEASLAPAVSCGGCSPPPSTSTKHGVRFAAGDARNAVKELRISYEAPVTTRGTYAVHLWLERLGNTGSPTASGSARRTLR